MPALHDFVAPHQQGLAQAGMLEGGRGADDAFFFAFGEHHALGLGAHAGGDLIWNRVAEGSSRADSWVAVVVEVLDLAPRHARFDRRFGDGAAKPG